MNHELIKRDLFEATSPFKIVEEQGTVGNTAILAKVQGPFFVPNGTSRNKRFYSEQLWSKCIGKPSVQERLLKKRMFGTIGHETEINDETLLEGKISHIVTDLAVEKNDIKGYGEALILDTPAGRILNTVIRAGAGMFTSSRALGKFNGNNEAGVPKIDEDTYDLQTFDFVIEPGFLQANPKVVESLNELHKPEVEPQTKIIETSINKKDQGDKMELQELLKKSTEEVGSVKAKLSEAVDANKALTAQVEDLKKQLSESSKSAPVAAKAEDYKKQMEAAQKLLKEYQEIGMAKDIKIAFAEAKKLISAYRVHGTPVQITQALTSAHEVLSQYREIGTPKQVNTVLEKFTSIAVEQKKAIEAKKIATLAKELSVSEAKVKSLYGKLSESEIRDLFKDVKEEVVNQNRFAKKPVVESTKKVTTGAPAPDGKYPWNKKSSGETLLEHFMRNTEDNK